MQAAALGPRLTYAAKMAYVVLSGFSAYSSVELTYISVR